MAVCHDPVLILYKKCFTPKYLRKPTKLKSIENNFTCVHLTEACAGLSKGGGGGSGGQIPPTEQMESRDLWLCNT